MTTSSKLTPLLTASLLAVTRAQADVTVGGTRTVRNWHIPGGQTMYVFTFTLLFGAAVWLLARGIWFRDKRKRIANLAMGGLSFALRRGDGACLTRVAAERPVWVDNRPF